MGYVLLILSLAIQVGIVLACSYVIVMAWDTYRGRPKGFPIFVTGLMAMSVTILTVLYIPVFMSCRRMIEGG
jgi:hypothetical protein